MAESTRTSKTLSSWLRNSPEAAGLDLDSEGWAATEAVLAALRKAGLPGTPDDLARVVAASDKNRFELSGGHIRARQGHSVNITGDWRAATPPALLYHGTVDRLLASILAQGLVPGARHHVHLAADLATARKVGARRGRPVILEVAAGELAAQGAEFLLTGNGVWLVEQVPPSALRVLE